MTLFQKEYNYFIWNTLNQLVINLKVIIQHFIEKLKYKQTCRHFGFRVGTHEEHEGLERSPGNSLLGFFVSFVEINPCNPTRNLPKEMHP